MEKRLPCFAAAMLFAMTNLAFAAPKTVTLDVPGMTCAMCPITVKKALAGVQGVSKVDVSYEKKEAAVTFDDSKVRVEALTAATRDAGYPATVKKQ